MIADPLEVAPVESPIVEPGVTLMRQAGLRVFGTPTKVTGPPLRATEGTAVGGTHAGFVRDPVSVNRP
jgi:hypothetical protein